MPVRTSYSHTSLSHSLVFLRVMLYTEQKREGVYGFSFFGVAAIGAVPKAGRDVDGQVASNLSAQTLGQTRPQWRAPGLRQNSSAALRSWDGSNGSCGEAKLSLSPVCVR